MSTFVLALDGADPDLLSKWMKDGHLGNLRKIGEQGMSGRLESTFPPLTAPAWSTFQTGVNPGKHGVYSWLEITDSYQGKVVDADAIRTRTVWDELSVQGRPLGLVSVPMTYPPPKVNGFVVPGFLTPCSAERKSFPEELGKELLEAVPDYSYLSQPFMGRKDPKQWVEQTKEVVNNRGRAARYLYRDRLGKEDEVMVVHFFATDQVQHHLWDQVSDDWDPRLEVFEEVDQEIGEIMEMAPDDSTFIVLSDHGFGPLEKTFNVNTWLKSEGYLELKSSFKTKLKKIPFEAGLTQQKARPLGEFIYPIAKKLGLVGNPVVELANNEWIDTLFLSARDVAWEKTSAYSRSDVGHVRINQLGREELGPVSDGDYEVVRDEIMRKLEQVKVPGTDNKVAEWVKPKEQLYSGPYLKKAPDILFNSLEGSNCQGGILGYGAVMFYNSKIISDKLHSAHHRRDGILMACGQGVERQKKNASIMDLAPTILNLSGCKIPKQMDGEVIGEVSPAEPSYYEPNDFYRKSVKVEESEEVRKRMESLGYL